MNRYSVVVVDDEERLRKQVETALGKDPRVAIHTAESLPAAMDVLANCFLNAAFVDIQLSPGPEKNIDGKVFLRHLADKRPSCRRFVLTQYPDKYRKDFFDILNPRFPLIEGAIDKLSFRQNVNDMIAALADQWLEGQLSVEGLTGVADVLGKRLGRMEEVQFTVDELDYLIRVLFGQGSPLLTDPSSTFISKVSMDLMKGGRSRSVVSLARPSDLSGTPGIWCVIKIGPRADAMQEYARYCHHVKYYVSLNRRVELLNYVSADTIGAMCYSFAGKSPDRVTSLEELLLNKSRRAIRCLDSVFDADKKEWYASIGSGEDLAKFFSDNHGLEPVSVLEGMHDFVERVAPTIGGSIRGDSLRLKAAKFEIPRARFGEARLRDSYVSCVVHGDMNPGNVLVSDDNRAILIDYSHTGRGPCALDFAFLESTIRIMQKGPVTAKDLIEARKVDRSIWKDCWRPSRTKAQHPQRPKLPYWATVSKRLKQLARVNFPELSAEQYAATCFLSGMRFFRITALSDEARLRLFGWMSTLSELLI